MNNSGKQPSFSDREDDEQQQSNDDFPPVSGGTDEVPSTEVSTDSSTRRNRHNIGLPVRLADLFAGDGDGDIDLLMQRNTQEGTVVQWPQAFDMQVTGACRADERLKPLLKLNVSSAAEDRLLSHLSQHFEPSEVGLLARCLCIPLVSIRVGKINKQGTLLIPTTARGNLVLSLLPTSDVRISFLGDDGNAERLSILRNTSDCSSVVIERIQTDTSGRSFTLKIPNTDPLYFWCSEKSRLLGNELLEKMKSLLERKPTLAEVTGISNSRLHHLGTYLIGSVGESSQSPSLVSGVGTCNIQDTLSPRPTVEAGPHLNQSFKFPESSSSENTVDMMPPQIPCIPSSIFFPPVVSTFQYMVVNTTAESFTLPPLSSLLLAPLNISELPPFLPLSMPVSQQIPIFTPLMCDPIVHIPVIDICSSGPAYIVSVGPAIIPLVEESDSEKSARETLRLLLSGSSQFPSVLASTVCISNTTDANSIAVMGLVLPRVVEQGECDLVEILNESVESDGGDEDGLSEGSTE